MPRLLAQSLSLLPLLALLALPLCACEEEPEDNALEQAFARYVAAVRSGDPSAIWEQTTTEFRARCDALYAELKEARGLMERYFPTWQHPEISRQLALDRFGAVKSGREMFVKLVDLEQVRSGPGVDAGLAHEPPQVAGDRATFRTQAGETFTFVLEEDGTWRTDVYEEALQTFPLIDTLRTNIATLRNNTQRLQELYRSADNPATPEGAFNQLRDSLARPDGAVILKMLDEPARKSVEQIRAALAKLVKSKAPDLTERLSRARLEGVDAEGCASSARRVAAELARNNFLGELLGIQPDSAVHLVRLESRSEAVILTSEAEEVPFARADDGLWHVVDTAPALREAVLDPLTVE